MRLCSGTREFEKPRRRRRVQRRLTYESITYMNLALLFFSPTVKTITKLNLENNDKFEVETL